MKALDRWIHGMFPVSAEALGIYRIAFALFYLIYGVPSYAWIANNPPGYFNPTWMSPGRFLLDGFPPQWVLLAISIALAVAMIGLLVGYRTRLMSFAVFALMMAGYTAQYCFGRTDGTSLMIFTPALMSFSNWGAAYSIDARRRARAGKPRQATHNWPLTMMAMFISFGYLTAGYPKLMSWVDFDLTTQGVRRWTLNGYYLLERRDLLAGFMATLKNTWVWEIMDVTAVMFELGAAIAIVHRSTFRAAVFVAVVFHWINMLMLNIPFAIFLPCYLLFIPWEPVTRWFAKPGPGRVLAAATSWQTALVLVVVWLGLHAIPSEQLPMGAAAWLSPVTALLSFVGINPVYWFALVHTASVLLAIWCVVSAYRRTMAWPAGYGVAYFDGVCNLCNGTVDFLVRRDKKRRLRYASLQSRRGEEMLTATGLREQNVDSFVLERDGSVVVRSTAVLAIVHALGGGYRLVGLLWLIPQAIRDVVYRAVAKTRYATFGKRDSCRLPSPEELDLFVEDTAFGAND